MFDQSFGNLYSSYEQYVRDEKAAGRKPVSFAKYMFGNF